MSYLLLYFTGPMQSWGQSSRFHTRVTQPHPTRSAVTGMICAAMGVDRSDTEVPKQLATLKMETLVLEPGLRWMDFHTVGGGYGPDQQQCVPIRADGSKGLKSGKGCVITKREYLSDAVFAAILSGNETLIEVSCAALENPVWGIWLGRKSCPPTMPICQGVHASRDEALARLAELGHPKIVRTITESEDGERLVNDVPVCFATRQFRARLVD